MRNFSPTDLAILYRHIEADDNINPEAALPPGFINFSCSEETRQACYYMALQLLDSYVDNRRLRCLIMAVTRRRAADAEQLAAFRKARTCFKHMRFCCANFDKRHRYPQHLHLLVVMMGQFQDAIINRQKAKITALGLGLLLLLSPAPRRALRYRLAAYRPATERSYRRYLDRENRRLARFLAREPLQGTGKELHKLRKIISRRVALNDALRSLQPSAGRDAVSLCLASLNGMLGEIHDVLVSLKTKKLIDYQRHRFTLPNAVTDRLKSFLKSQI